MYKHVFFLYNSNRMAKFGYIKLGSDDNQLSNVVENFPRKKKETNVNDPTPIKYKLQDNTLIINLSHTLNNYYYYSF